MLATITAIISAFAAAGALGLNARVQRNAQVWKRKEYVALLISDIKRNHLSGSAFLMLDWSGRRIALPIGDGGALKSVMITDDKVSAALIPHDYVNRPKYGRVGGAVRDSFDAFFDKITEIEVMIKEKLIKFDDVRPYLEYYITIIGNTSHRNNSRSHVIRNIRIFIAYYDYKHVQDFVMRFSIQDQSIIPTEKDKKELMEECKKGFYKSPDGEDMLD